ncbi:odorant receptor 22b isoform X1 [Solenopsis invicta]|uniref:odorant receptor 22b isoform X1 n=1 Tax=Solenopsis invicta TaxID=13686 RepID=UPI00193D0395|nr:odorant receptor 22b isoform X1 [Solenopsis invicta]
MEFSVDQQYRLNRLVLSIYGLWPYHNRTTDARIKRVIAILLMFYITFIQVTKICMTELTANFILDVLPILIPSAGVIIQIINRIIINDELRNLFDQIKIDWESVRSQHEIEIMQRSVKNALLTTKVVLLDMFIGMTLYMLTTFSPQILDVLLPLNESRPWEHPFHVEFFFLDNERDLYIIRFILYFGAVFGLGVILANGSIFVIYTQHATGMFTILGHRAKQTFSDEQLPNSQFIHEKDYKSIALFVEDHRSILQFVDMVRSCYGSSLFLEFFSLMILLGTTMVQIIKFSGMSDRPMRSAAYVTGQIMYMFMYSYMGQQLIDKSSQLSMKIYSVRWQSIAVCKQKMMLFVMLKCMHTITINAYNIFYLSLESFSSIVQSAMSVCMLLRQV